MLPIPGCLLIIREFFSIEYSESSFLLSILPHYIFLKTHCFLVFFFSSHKSATSCTGCFSCMHFLNFGIPQGWVWAPKLFSHHTISRAIISMASHLQATSSWLEVLPRRFWKCFLWDDQTRSSGFANFHMSHLPRYSWLWHRTMSDTWKMLQIRIEKQDLETWEHWLTR